MGPFAWAGCLARTRRLLCWRWILSLGWGSSGRCSLGRLYWRGLPFVVCLVVRLGLPIDLGQMD